MTADTDLETCSWCLTEVPDSKLKQLPDGARICESCRHPTGQVGLEARCTEPTCGHTFNPNNYDPDDGLEHGWCEDCRELCGGAGQPTGSWR